MTKETTLSSIDGMVIPYVERWGGRAYEVLVYMARITPSAAGALIADERQRNRGTNERVSNERVRAVRGVREEHGDYY